MLYEVITGVAHAHDGALAELFLDLTQGGAERLGAVVIHSIYLVFCLSVGVRPTPCQAYTGWFSRPDYHIGTGSRHESADRVFGVITSYSIHYTKLYEG